MTTPAPAPAPTALAAELSRVLARLMHLWLHATRRFARAHGLSVGQLMVLRQLQFSQPCTVSDLAQRMGVTNAAASQILDRLAEQGLITRNENPADRRSKSVVLTPGGQALLDEAAAWHQAWLHELIGAFSPAERLALQQALHILDHHLPPLTARQPTQA